MTHRPIQSLALLALGLTLAACSSRITGGGPIPRPPDGGADALPPMPNACGDFDPSCAVAEFGPPRVPFPLGSDRIPDPRQSDQGLARDMDGYLILGQSQASFDFIYSANTDDWGRGTVSKIDSKKVREVARYATVTCWSNKEGGRQACDGTSGCCAADDHGRFTRREANQPEGARQAVQVNDNSPSRTAVDWSGDFWVANRAFGGQSSVTKIANDLASCVDRNGTPGIQTSADVNGDGIIDTDCNRNRVPDDVADVMGKPCANGMAQEFFGLDDECVLFTTNTNGADQYGRPLALGPGTIDNGVSDAWAGGYQNGAFFRVDGTTGRIKAQGKVPGQPYGATVDSSGILWAPGLGGGGLFYLDTKNPQNAGRARDPDNGLGGYGIALDRDQNVWVGGYPNPHAYRYTPDRTNGFASLGKGYWTTVTSVGDANGAGGCQGRGIAADSRTQQNYFVWMACHGAPFIVRIDGNIPLPAGQDRVVDGRNMPAIRVAGSSICGAGVDVQQNVWAISSGPAIATRIPVDMAGNPAQPDLAGAPGGTGCPVGKGDFCGLGMAAVDPGVTGYTYSDFTGFGLRNFTTPKGEYTFILRGCDGSPTKWLRADWDAQVPPNTALSFRARVGNTPAPDNTWGAWTSPSEMSPADLAGMGGPTPAGAGYIQVKFTFTTMDKAATPRLKAFRVLHECDVNPG